MDCEREDSTWFKAVLPLDLLVFAKKVKNHVRVLCISCKFLGEWKKVSFVSKLGNVTKFSKNSLKGLELRLSESAAVFELERDGCRLAWVLERG